MSNVFTIILFGLGFHLSFAQESLNKNEAQKFSPDSQKISKWGRRIWQLRVLKKFLMEIFCY